MDLTLHNTFQSHESVVLSGLHHGSGGRSSDENEHEEMMHDDL